MQMSTTLYYKNVSQATRGLSTIAGLLVNVWCCSRCP